MVMQRDGYVFDTCDDLVKMDMEMVLEWSWIGLGWVLEW